VKAVADFRSEWLTFRATVDTIFGLGNKTN
jgi:hypothetical protein